MMGFFRRSREATAARRPSRDGATDAPPDADLRIEPALDASGAAPARGDVHGVGRIGSEHIIDGACGERLTYDAAAARLVAWMQAKGETGEITLPRLRLLYRRHCDEECLAWLPEGRLLQAIVSLIGEDRRHERSVPRPDRIRQRVRTYDIPAAAPVAAGRQRSARVA